MENNIKMGLEGIEWRVYTGFILPQDINRIVMH
jgi:hypothetical protein